MASAAGPRRTAQKLQSGVKPAHVAASNVSPVSHRGAKQKARAAIAQVAEKAPALDTGRFERGRYALAYLASMSPQHPVPPPANPADAAKLAHAQADMLVGVIRAVLDGLGLSDEDWERGSKIAQEELRACSRQGWEPL